jgi:hypothetical protein
MLGCLAEPWLVPYAAAEQLLQIHERTVLPTALLFLHRFYAVKSMQRNDRFIMACACLFLAAKVEDVPKALNDVAFQCYKQRCEPQSLHLHSLLSMIVSALFLGTATVLMEAHEPL